MISVRGLKLSTQPIVNRAVSLINAIRGKKSVIVVMQMLMKNIETQ